MRRLVAFTWNYYLKHPEFLTLLNSENLHQRAPPARSRQIARDAFAAGGHAARPARARRAQGRVPRAAWIRCSSTSRSRRWATFTSATATRCRPFSRATCCRRAANPSACKHMTALVLGYLSKVKSRREPCSHVRTHRRNRAAARWRCTAHAQWKPTKPINIIVPWAAGGATDQVTRVAAGELEEALGAKIVVINQPGARRLDRHHERAERAAATATPGPRARPSSSAPTRCSGLPAPSSTTSTCSSR